MLKILCDVVRMYIGTVIVSFILTGVSITVATFSKRRKQYLYERYGLREYFEHRGGTRIYTMLFFPLVNLLIAVGTLLAVLTDVGDDLE